LVFLHPLVLLFFHLWSPELPIALETVTLI
jgi:hypothetical protein